MTAKIFPRFQQLSDFSIININCDDEGQLGVEVQEIERRQTEKFKDLHPEFYQCLENADQMEAWLYLHGDLPATLWNLEIAFRDLTEDGLLKTAPPPEPIAVDKMAGITLTVSDALAEYIPSDKEAAQLAKVVDSPDLNDHQRRSRLKRLALLAGAQRREFAEQRRPDDRDPQIVI